MWVLPCFAEKIDDQSRMIAALVVRTASTLGMEQEKHVHGRITPSFIEFKLLVGLGFFFLDNLGIKVFNKWNVPNTLPLSTVKAVPRKCQVNFFLLLLPTNHQNVLLRRHSGESGWARRSILCLVSWNAFEVSVTLKTHQHMAHGKVRASLRVGTSSMLWRISHSGPCSVTQ